MNKRRKARTEKKSKEKGLVISTTRKVQEKWKGKKETVTDN